MSVPTILPSIIAGEIPDPLRTKFVDATGEALDLSGFTAQWESEAPDGTATAKAAAELDVAPDTDGIWWVTVTFDETDFAAPGPYAMDLWIDDGTVRHAQSFRVYARPAIAPPSF